MEDTYLESRVNVNIQPFHLQHHQKYNQVLGKKKPTKITDKDDNFWEGDEEKFKREKWSPYIYIYCFYNGGWSSVLMIQLMRGRKNG